MSESLYLAIDLGAESGRIIVGTLRSMTIVHRFPTLNVKINGSLFWDLPYLFHEIRTGLKLAFQSYGARIVSIGVDAWGSDYGLFDADGDLLSLPYHYRDARTDGVTDSFYAEVMSREDLFSRTGIQKLQFNTCFQLFAHKKRKPQQVDLAARLLSIPDILNYWLSGRMVCEYTEATAGSLVNAATRNWDWSLIDAMDLPRFLFGTIVEPGAVIGKLTSELAREFDAPPGVKIIAPACHDTGSAVAAVPAQGTDWAFLSSGTWSLLGVENAFPRLDNASREFGMTNEGGAEGTFRFLRNIMGLWLVQRLRSSFPGNPSYDELEALAEHSEPFACLVDPDHAGFFNPENMSRAFIDFARNTGQREPKDIGAFIRAAFDSLALQYWYVLEGIGKLQGKAVSCLYVVGGGTKQKFLCQLTADICGIPVYAASAESTALGNILLQSMAFGEIENLAAGRAIIRSVHGLMTYSPRPTAGLDSARDRFRNLKIKLE